MGEKACEDVGMHKWLCVEGEDGDRRWLRLDLVAEVFERGDYVIVEVEKGPRYGGVRYWVTNQPHQVSDDQKAT